jgi:hypothetical protein
VFGMPGTTGFNMWGFWEGAVWSGAPNGVLYNQDWTVRPTGTAWNNLQNQWNTDLALEVGPDGTISFNGFWGDYELAIGGQAYALTLSKGNSLYSLVVAPGDYNGDHVVDAADYIVWRDSLNSSTDLRADGNGNGMIDDDDFNVWRSHFGATYSGGASATNAGVPEPPVVVLCLFVAIALLRTRSISSRKTSDRQNSCEFSYVISSRSLRHQVHPVLPRRLADPALEELNKVSRRAEPR